MTTRMRYHYAYAFIFVAAVTGALLVGGSLRAANTPPSAMQDIRIDISAITASSGALPVLHIENLL